MTPAPPPGRRDAAAPVPAACLAIDAGNSKTDVAVIGADGTVLGAARGDGFQPPRSGVGAAVDGLSHTVARALATAGIATGQHAKNAPLPVPHVAACLANVDLPREEERLAAALAARGWGPGVRIANDTFAVLRAGLPDDGAARRGVAVVCGSGTNCVGRDDAGRTHRFPAVGRISGDWGGGGGLAAEALWYAARAEDGRGEETSLARELPAHFGLGSMYALIEALHLGDLPASRTHEIAPLLFAVAAEGDRVACELIHRQADELVALAAVTLERLNLLDVPTPVFLGGGVVAARHPLLDDRLTARLAARAPRATPHIVTAPPVMGAGLLALDAAGAPPQAHARLRTLHA